MALFAMVVEPITDANRSEAAAYLARHEDTSQFLINNLSEHGSRLTAHPNSGNFKLVRRGDTVVAVFCLTRRGNLLVQSDEDCAELVLHASGAEEEVPLKGFIGSWSSVAPIWRRFKEAHPDFTSAYESKEILYARVLREDDDELKRDPRVRLLELSDLDEWLAHSALFRSEVGLPDDVTAEQKREGFAALAHNRAAWGLFTGGKLLSRAALNSQGPTVGQTGAVFTLPGYRRQGLARSTMRHMLSDCRDIHRHRKNILFTGEADVPAQRLYESIRYERIGSFALILG
jgi:predicted GNAT family acetyltransferase